MKKILLIEDDSNYIWHIKNFLQRKGYHVLVAFTVSQGKELIEKEQILIIGSDVFKALALGADAVLIGRPFVPMVYGDGAQGVATYIEKIGSELRDTMAMCGVHTLGEITRDCVRVL